MSRQALEGSVPEFSRVVRVDDIPADGLSMDIAASADECQALAERFGLPGVGSLKGRVRLWAKDEEAGVGLEATLEATVTQTCVVSLEDVINQVREAVSLDFLDVDAVARMEQALALDPTVAEDLPEPVFDGQIDIGEVLAQYLALSLDPYPRKPEATLDGLLASSRNAFTIGEPDRGADRESPFAHLKRLTRGPRANT